MSGPIYVNLPFANLNYERVPTSISAAEKEVSNLFSFRQFLVAAALAVAGECQLRRDAIGNCFAEENFSAEPRRKREANRWVAPSSSPSYLGQPLSSCPCSRKASVDGKLRGQAYRNTYCTACSAYKTPARVCSSTLLISGRV